MIQKGESGGVRLLLDVGWTQTEEGFFKGFKRGDRLGHYVNIIKTDGGWKVEFDDYRSVGIVSNYQSVLSNHPIHRVTDNLPVDRDFEIKDYQI